MTRHETRAVKQLLKVLTHYLFSLLQYMEGTCTLPPVNRIYIYPND